MRDYYADLGLCQTASPTTAAIRACYRHLAKTHHPDRGGDASRMARIAKAYSILGCEESRDLYDRLRSTITVHTQREEAVGGALALSLLVNITASLALLGYAGLRLVRYCRGP